MNDLIVAAGDAVIDFMPHNETGVYKRNFGGAPANVCIAAVRMRATAAFCGMVGNDVFGRYLSDTLKENGVGVSGVRFTDRAVTTMTFVTHDERGDRDFVFVRKPGADMLYTAEDIDENLIRRAGAVHFCSVMLSCAGLRRAAERLIQIASDSGAIISFDVNYREPHWENSGEALGVISDFLGRADILKLSEEEALWCSGRDTLEEAARYFMERDNLTIITLGSQGALCIHKGKILRCGGFCVQVEDTTGAGDAFIGTFLARLMAAERKLADIREAELKEMIVRSNAAAALVVSRKGAISAMPGRSELDEFLSSSAVPAVEELRL